MSHSIKPIVIPHRARFHRDKVDELASRLNAEGIVWEWGAQLVVPQVHRVRNLMADIEMLREASDKMPHVKLSLERVNETPFSEYVEKLQEAMIEVQEEQGITPRCLYGLGLGRFSEWQIEKLMGAVELIWMSPTYYQRYPGDPIRDPGRDFSLSAKLHCPMAPFYYGLYARSGAALPQTLLNQQMAEARAAGITVGWIGANLDYPDAVDGIMAGVMAMTGTAEN
jgi:hypothetical protein